MTNIFLASTKQYQQWSKLCECHISLSCVHDEKLVTQINQLHLATLFLLTPDLVGTVGNEFQTKRVFQFFLNFPKCSIGF